MTFGVIVCVHVSPHKPRHFGLSSRQRTTRTRGVITRCRKIDFSGIRSGSGESWFDPRRGNSKRDGPTPMFNIDQVYIGESVINYLCRARDRQPGAMVAMDGLSAAAVAGAA